MIKSTLLLFLLLATGLAGSTAVAGGDPDKDSEMAQRLKEARQCIDRGESTAAIAKCDAVIAAFKSHYGSSTQQIFCTRTSAESLAVLLKAANDNTNAICLSSVWSDAYFMKGYALQDLNRVGEAKTMLQQALALSPSNSQYLAEMGELYALEANWPKAEQAYHAAEANASLAPEISRAEELARARRGLGYVFVELGKLDAAEKKYQQCLTANPKDEKAKAELKYVREQRAKQQQ